MYVATQGNGDIPAIGDHVGSAVFSRGTKNNNEQVITSACHHQGCTCALGDVPCVIGVITDRHPENVSPGDGLNHPQFRDDYALVKEQLLSGTLSRSEKKKLWATLEFKWQYALSVTVYEAESLFTTSSSGGGTAPDIADLLLPALERDYDSDDEELLAAECFADYDGGPFYWELIGDLLYDDTNTSSVLSVFSAFLEVIGGDGDGMYLKAVEFELEYGMGLFMHSLDMFSSDLEATHGKARMERVRSIMDSGCSKSISGIPGRLTEEKPIQLHARGANGGGMVGYRIGYNSDGISEVLVRGMAPGLVLLSVSDYAKKGLFIADSQTGSIIEMSTEEAEKLLSTLRQGFNEFVRVYVKNGVYEVDEDFKRQKLDYSLLSESTQSNEEVIEEEWFCPEFALSVTTFFNSKMSFRDVQEKIVGLLMSGFSLQNLRKMVRERDGKRMVTGIDPEITEEVLNEFEKEHGSSPTVLQAALKRLMGNMKSDEGEPLTPTHVGHYVQMDTFQYDFNRRVEGKTEKNPTLGGATSATITVDTFSGFLMGDLISKGTKAEEKVKTLYDRFKSVGTKIDILGADDAEISKSDLRIFTTETLQFVFDQGTKFLSVEPNSHANGGQYVEVSGQHVKNVMRKAFRIVFSNPKVLKINWTVILLVRLWGEIFFWALMVINLTECPNCPGKTRFEVFMKSVPDMQQIRMFPILCMLLVWNYQGDPDTFSGQPHWEYGLYTGPYHDYPLMMAPHGVIRAAVRTENGAKILATSKYKDVSMGGNIDLHEVVERGLRKILDKANVKSAAGVGETNESNNGPDVRQLRTGDKRGLIDEPLEEAQASGKDGVDTIGPIHPNVPDDGIRPGRKLKKRKQKVRFNEEKVQQDKTIKDLTKEYVKKRAEQIVLASGKQVSKTQVKRAIRQVKTGDKEEAKHQYWSKYQTGARDRERRTQIRNLRAKLVEVQETNVSLDILLSDLETRPLEEGHVSWIDLEPGERLFSLRDRCAYEFGTSDEGVQFMEKLDEVGLSFERIYSSERVTKEDIDWGDLEGYRVVTEGVPKDIIQALEDKDWGEPARTEINLLADKVMVKLTDAEFQLLKKAGCDIVRLFPIYEIKMRDGKEVRKVRLVADGRTHKPEGPTYAATPSREEFLILLHLIAKNDWDFIHIDESRAFTGAPHTDSKPVVVKMKGDTAYWKVINALYGLKTAPLMYQRKSIQRLESMGFKRKEMCSNTYIKYYVQADGATKVVIIYGYVDDYFFTSDDTELLRRVIQEFRDEVIRTGTNTTEPSWNPAEGLGMEFSRDREKRVIMVRMSKKITELYAKFRGNNKSVKQKLPMSEAQYKVREHEFIDLPAEQVYRAALLDKEGINKYLAVVGSLLWIMGIRFDINFSVTYLTWFSHLPRVHHMEVALRVVDYLMSTVDEPLVLGGTADLEIITYTDAALGIAPKGRSVIAEFTRLGAGAGAVNAKTMATEMVHLSSFETELDGTGQGLDENERIAIQTSRWNLDGVSRSFKTSARVANILTELDISAVKRVIYGDNEKCIQFCKREVEGKNVRHAELRLWYIRQELQQQGVLYEWMPGNKLDVNAMTKPVGIEELTRMRWNVLGHQLLGVPEPLVRVSKTVSQTTPMV